MRFTIIRLESDRFLKSSRRFFVTLGPEIDGAEVVVGLGIRRLERERFFVRVDCGIKLLVLVECGAEAVVRVCMIALESNSRLKLGDCFFELPTIVERSAEIIVRFRKIGLR